MSRFALAAVALTIALGVGVFAVLAALDDGSDEAIGTTTTTTAASTTSLIESTTSLVTTTTAATTTTTSGTSTTTSSTTTTTSATTTTTLAPTTTAPKPPFSSSITTPTESQLHSSWEPGCPVGPSELRLITMTHWNYAGTVSTGQLVVAAELADQVVAIFRDIYDEGFPIERMRLVDEYGGDDDASMSANNTSAFNCRTVTGGDSYSEHSYGRAIDINPLVNPYVKGSTVLPPEGSQYADRSLDAPGMIHSGDEVVTAFAARGWVWGGTWSSLKDYQHFSTTGR